MKTTHLPALVTAAVGLMCFALVSAASAQPKDPDGQRKRARKVKVGTSVKDSLGEGDRADWRYVKVATAGRMLVEVRYEPADAPLSLAITDAKGKPLLEAAGEEPGLRQLRLEAKPGIYFLEVAGEKAATYVLEVEVR